jgi:CBS domain containing-hemolysin-like protein
VMTPRPDIAWLDVTASADRLRQQILETGRSRYPVARGSLDTLIGVALAQQALRDLDGRHVIDAKTCMAEPLIVPEWLGALDLLERFRRERNHFAVIVDESGSVQGVATPTDLLEAIAGALPEPDDARLVAGKQSDGSWILHGSTELGRAYRLLELRPPHGAYMSLGEHIRSAMDRLPQVGETVERDGMRFEVVSLDGRRIETVKVRRAPSPVGADAAVSE